MLRSNLNGGGRDELVCGSFFHVQCIFDSHGCGDPFVAVIDGLFVSDFSVEDWPKDLEEFGEEMLEQKCVFHLDLPLLAKVGLNEDSGASIIAGDVS